MLKWKSEYCNVLSEKNCMVIKNHHNYIQITWNYIFLIPTIFLDFFFLMKALLYKIFHDGSLGCFSVWETELAY